MSMLTRREMLEQSMFAATAALAASSGGLLFAADEQSDQKSIGPNDKIGLAIIGAGGRGGEHIAEYLKNPNCEILYIVDADEKHGDEKCETIAKKSGRKPKNVTDLRKALEDPNLHATSIATPNHWHALAAIWSMQAGKDVYVEKPVSHNVSEGRRVVETARKYNRICQTGTQSRSTTAINDGINYVKSGKIGEVNLARALCYKPRGSIGPKVAGEVPSTVNYDLWLGPAPMKQPTRKQFHYDWHWFWDYGSGDLGNQGIHQMDLARWGLGLDTLPSNVLSYGGRLGYEDAGETANTQIILHDYGPKTIVFEVRGLDTQALPLKPFKGARVGVIYEGTDGYVVLTHDYNTGTAFDKNGKLVQTFKGGGSHFDNFLSAVRSRKVEDLHADIQEGHLSSALCHLGNISYRLGEQVSFAEAAEKLKGIPSHDNNLETFERFKGHLAEHQVPVDKITIALGQNLPFDAKAEKFVKNDKADALLTREYRAPYVVPAQGKV